MNKIDIYKIQRFLDATLVAFCSLYVDGVQRLENGSTIMPLSIWVFLIYYTSSGNAKLYQSSSKRIVEIAGKLTTTWIYTIFLMLAILYLSKISSTISRSSSIEWCLICILMTLTTNIIIFRYTRGNKKWIKENDRVLLWGNHESFEKLSIHKNIGPNENNIAWFSKDKCLNENNLGGTKEMIDWLKNNNPTKILFIQDKESNTLTAELINRFGNTSASVYFIPKWFNESMSLNLEEVCNRNFVRVWGSVESKIDENIKRFFDIIFSSAALLLLSPLFLIIGVLIKMTSTGPIFFTQKRGGLNGKPFKMLKFRSMYYRQNNDEKDIVQATKEDLRVTSIGKLLRKWSIDELPQLINVLKGEMSIVGPRPHAIQHDEKYSNLINGYVQRHSVKPGMTGLAQIRGFRGETKTVCEMRNRVFSDLMYQRSWSLENDVGIILETLSVLGSRNSY
tara:strand:+ start:1986 stop:3335 length:1350 start_codon:yes stop_codon:yes gene_type:complete